MENNSTTNLRKITALAGILILVAAGYFTYLLFTQPKHKLSTADQPISISVANPIVKKLPYVDPYYTIDYKTVSSTSNDIVITIHTPSPRYRYYALKQLYALGGDPTNLTVQFSDYTNPLEATR